MTRVPGCVATVYIMAETTITTITQDDDEEEEGRVMLYGYSDAIFSRGLLVSLRNFLTSQTREEVLKLNPEDIADILNVRKALSKGRNDGVANMLRIIQQQLLLLSSEDNKSN